MQQEHIALDDRIMTVEEVFGIAHKHMFKRGKQAPLLIVNLRSRKLFLIPIGKDPLWDEGDDAKVFSLFFNGRQFAAQEKIGPRDILALYLIQEVWYLTREDGAITPADLANTLEEHERRHEGVGVFALHTTPSLSTTFYRSEIIRGSGEVLDMGPIVALQETEPKFLPAFLAGTSTGTWDEETFQKILGQYLRGS